MLQIGPVFPHLLPVLTQHRQYRDVGFAVGHLLAQRPGRCRRIVGAVGGPSQSSTILHRPHEPALLRRSLDSSFRLVTALLLGLLAPSSAGLCQRS